jgi:hypothetical protein
MDNNDITLNGSTATWRMPRTDGDLGGTYLGTFEFRCWLDPIRQLQAGREYRALLGELAAQATEDEGRLAFALTQIKYRALTVPPFWSSTSQESGISGNIGDLNIITMVLDAAFLSENLYKEKIAKERQAILERSIKVAEDLLQKEQTKETV